MTTLAIMKARIASELFRTDLTDAIAAEITSAIKFYRPRRFFFTEKRTQVTFNTANGVDTYGASAQANIPNLVRIDSALLTHDGHVSGLRLLDQARMDAWLGSNSPLSGDPAWFSYYGQELRLYPRPDGVYPIQIAGVVRVPAPATDTEADNAWMIDGEELIRSRAKKAIYANWMHDPDMANVAAASEAEALNNLLVETSSRTQISRLVPADL